MMISRRTFFRRGLGAAAFLASPPFLSRAFAVGTGSVYQRAIVIDTLTPDGPNFDPQVAVAAGLTAAVVDLRMFPRNFPGAVGALADWSSTFHRADSGFLKILRAADLAEAKQRKKLGIILACQDASILDASTGSVNDYNLRNLRFFYDLGLR